MRLAPLLFLLTPLALACEHDCPSTADSLQVVQADIVYSPSAVRVSDFIALACGRAIAFGDGGSDGSADRYAACVDAGANPANAQQNSELSAATMVSTVPGSVSAVIGCSAAGETEPCMLVSLNDPRFTDPALGSGGGDGYDSRIYVHRPGPGTYALSDLHAQYCEFADTFAIRSCDQTGCPSTVAPEPASCTPLEGTMTATASSGDTVV